MFPERRCDCDECQAATGPLAYLVELFRYALAHLRLDSAPVTLDTLAGRFFQPFGSLPDSCASMEDKVRQVRIAIEVLRRYLDAHAPSSDANAKLTAVNRKFLLAAYGTLLAHLGTSDEELRIATDASETERSALANRLAIELTPQLPFVGDELDELTLAPEAVTEETLERIFGFPQTAPGTPAPTSPPRISQLRLAFLHAEWVRRDWPADAYTPAAPASALPVIDPDVIGPEDIRATRVSPPGPALTLWLERRATVDGILKELRAEAAALLAAPPASFDALLTKYVAAPATLTDLLAKLAQGTHSEADEALASLTELGLTEESLRRLAAIRAHHALGKSAPPVAADEWSDLVGIVAQVRKTALFAEWRKDEQNNGIALGPNQFWLSLREPLEGEWPPLEAGVPIDEGAAPMVDPDLVRLRDLPDSSVGERARTLWIERRATLDSIARDLAKLRDEKGFDAVLSAALGAGTDYAALEARLDSSDPTVAAAASATVESHLLTVADFRLLMSFRQRAIVAGPSEGEWDPIAAILTGVRKRKSLLAGWRDEERGPDFPRLRYWEARKAALSPWRARAELRQGWRQGLKRRSGRPHVDPDLLLPEDFVKAADGDPAYDLWKSRFKAAADAFAALNAPESRAAGFDTVMQRELATDAGEFDRLAKAEVDGESVAGRLDQLSLSPSAYRRLTRLRSLAAKKPLLDPEWQELANILVQVRKAREFGTWREEERAKEVTLGPRFFTVPNAAARAVRAAHPVDVSPWRAPRDARMDWDETLGGRIDQEQTVHAALADAVDATEDATLTILRDGLVEATDAPGDDLDGKATWLTRRLFLDLKAGSCQTTTRAAQAIETVQGILYAARAGQETPAGVPATPPLPRLTLSPPIGHDEWKWINSYATWRAAMFVFLYPENILVPTLRAKQTPAFEQFVETLRTSQHPTPQLACRAASAYADYYRDVCTLTVDATCLVQTAFPTDDRCGVGGSTEQRFTMHLFGRGGSTGRAYWSTCTTGPGPTVQTPWRPVPPLQESKVDQIVGAAAYAPPEGRFLYLFARTTEKGEGKLVYCRYDLQDSHWDPSFEELEQPPSGSYEAILVQQFDERHPPGLALKGYALYERELDREGKQWHEDTAATTDGDAWAQYVRTPGVSADVGKLHAVLSRWYASEFSPTAPQEYHPVYCYTDRKGQLCLFDSNVYGNKKSSLGSDASFLGMVQDRVVFGWKGGVAHAEIGWYFGFTAAPTSLPWELAPKAQEIKRIAVNTMGVFPGSARPFDHLVAADLRIGKVIVPHLVAFGGWSTTFEFKRVAALRPSIDSTLAELPEAVFNAAAIDRPQSLIYLQEAYYFVPVYAGLQLQASGFYDDALAWFRRVYDFTRLAKERKRYPGLIREMSLSPAFAQPADWLRDPLNPHAIASNRKGTYSRFTLLAIIRCLIEYADAEFTRDTAESLPHARTLYQTALDLFDTDELRFRPDICGKLLLKLEMQVEPLFAVIADGIKRELGSLDTVAAVTKASDAIATVMAGDGTIEKRLAKAGSLVSTALATQPKSPELRSVLEQEKVFRSAVGSDLLRQAPVLESARQAMETASADHLKRVSVISRLSPGTLQHEAVELRWLRGDGAGLPSSGLSPISNKTLTPMSSPSSGNWGSLTITPSYVPGPTYTRCVAPNPLIDALRLRAALNLHKLRTCRNIAGMVREVEPYAAPTDLKTGMPMIGAGGVLELPGAITLRPTPYRFSTLIERAKQLVGLAQQAESAMLAALERRDAEAYTALQARQNLGTSRAGIQLQDLRLREAEGGVTLAELGQQRAQLQVDHYTGLLDEGLSDLETAMIATQIVAAAAKAAAAVGGAFASSGADAASTAADAISQTASIIGEYASFERRAEEWHFQQSLAEQDVRIGAQQVRIANDHVRVVGQERKIAQLQVDHTVATVDFLTTKFTNADLFDWMSGVLQGVYAFFLQQATATARLAAVQLAFERQESPPPVIQDDYWSAPAEGGVSGERQPDRRGLTGSARLLQDIFELDQHAFTTNKRKLQLTKTFSLARLAPVEFERFRRSGVLRFATPMDLFDRDFPGHYGRLIRRVRTSVVALVPPGQGIRATLSCAATSRVTIAGDLFQTVVVRRAPESIALSSARDATGVFELDLQPELLLPFEGIGVDTLWELRMPRAANAFDYGTIADVLVTIDYTALDSSDYREQVIASMRPTVSGELPYSFRHQFADQWYDLHNPDQTATPMTVRFTTSSDDFPPNLDRLKIQQLLLSFKTEAAKAFEVSVKELRFKERGGDGSVGGGATTIDGVISTRRGNGASWAATIGKSPVGEWELVLPKTDEMRSRFSSGEIADMLLVVGYSGRPPNWPA